MSHADRTPGHPYWEVAMTTDGDDAVPARPSQTGEAPATSMGAVAARPSQTGEAPATSMGAVAARPSQTGEAPATSMGAVAARRVSVDSDNAEVLQLPPRSQGPWNRVRGKIGVEASDERAGACKFVHDHMES